jgi:single-strand DNA-binding protein
MLRNQVQLIGRLGADPEVKHFDDGKVKASMRMATNGYYTNKQGEKVEDTQWHNVITWGNTATIAEKYLKKGSELAVQGKLVHRSYEDKEGHKRYVTEVVAQEVTMLGKAPS